MSAMRMSLTEPFALTRRVRESFADWFEQDEAATASLDVASLDVSEVNEAHELVVVRAAGELSPESAGAMVGALAGPATIGLAMWLANKAHRAIDLPLLASNLVSHGAIRGAWSHAVGWSVAVLAGALVGMLFARLTRRLRSLAPMIAFGVVMSFATWTVFHAIALPRIAPWLAKMLPYGPMAIAAMAFGSLLALQVPVRTRRLV